MRCSGSYEAVLYKAVSPDNGILQADLMVNNVIIRKGL